MTEIRNARPRRPLHRHLAGATPLAIALTYGGGAWLQFLHAREGGRGAQRARLPRALAARLDARPAARAARRRRRLLARARRRAALRAPRPSPGSRAASPRPPARSRPPMSSASATRSTRCSSPRTTAATSCRSSLHMLRDGALALPACLLIAAVTVRRGRASLQRGRAPARVVGRRRARRPLRARLRRRGAGLRPLHAGRRAGPRARRRRPAVPDRRARQALRRRRPSTSTSRSTASATTTPTARCTSLTEDDRRRARAGGEPQGLRSACATTRSSRSSSAPTSATASRSTTPTTPSGGEFGVHIDGLAFNVASSGDAVGRNVASSVPPRRDAHLPLLRARGQGARGHALHPPRPRLPPGRRRTASSAPSPSSPKGSIYLHPDTGAAAALRLGGDDQAASGKAAFREYVKIYHEIGDEKAPVLGRDGHPLPDGRPDHGGLPPRLARHQLPLRAVHAPPGAGRRQEVAPPTTPTRSATRRRR